MKMLLALIIVRVTISQWLSHLTLSLTIRRTIHSIDHLKSISGKTLLNVATLFQAGATVFCGPALSIARVDPW
ncbi:MAG TPA: hypothetical protein VFN23_05935, partial [Ktedonobacteraceae bacterium]|nr:hypothetical protein [Ktedonobacteraceae bacterium]